MTAGDARDTALLAPIIHAMRTDFVHAVIPGPAPPAPRPRAQIIPLASAPVTLARAREAATLRQLFGLFRASVYTPTAIQKWKQTAAAYLEQAKRAQGYGPRPIIPQGEALEVWVLIVGELPQSKHRKTPSKQPPRAWQTSLRAGDWDNLGKPVCDAATGVLWHDDCQVARATLEKVVARQGEKARLEFIARPIWDSPVRTRFELERDSLLHPEEERIE